MGNYFSRVIRNPAKKLLILGCEKSGKTTIFGIINQKYNFKPRKIDEIKSNGFNVDLVKDIVMWDLSGKKTMIKFWGCYFNNVDGTIWVLDALKTNNDVLDMMHDILTSENIQKAKLLFCIHKSDLVDEIVILNLTEKVQSMFTNRKFKILSTTISNHQQIYEGFDWLSESITPSRRRTLDFFPYWWSK